MAVFAKKEEKVASIFNKLGAECTLDEFSKEFKSSYSKEWEQIKRRYNQHERRDKKGKGHPMPHPTKYMEEMYKTGKHKHLKNTQNVE